MQETGKDSMIDAVERLVVCHLDNILSTPVAVQPTYLLKHGAVRRFETTDPNDIRAAFDSVIAAAPVVAKSGLDTRWGMFFIGREGEEILVVYTDRFGLKGMIADEGVRFARPGLRRWLEERLAP